jgi:hypothetical protein
MALTAKRTDGVSVVHAVDTNQIQDLLTGVMTDQRVTLAGGLTVNNVVSFGPPSGGDDSTPLQTLVTNMPAAGGTIMVVPGTYLVHDLTWKSNVSLWAYPGTVNFKNVTASKNTITTTGTLDQVSIIGINFDMTSVAWSALCFTGSDAGGQVTNLTIRDCRFKNPSSTWMIQISYTIVDPTIPSSKNTRIRIEDCYDDATGQASTLENWILVNCQDVVIANNTLQNATATLGAQIGIYGYCRNVRFIGNYTSGFACARALYIQQSDNVVVLGDQFRTATDTSAITVFNSKDVSITGCTSTLPLTGNGAFVGITDHAGATFDGHTNLYTPSSNVRVQSNRADGGSYTVALTANNMQGQTDVFVESNMVSPYRSLFLLSGIPASPSGTIKNLNIQGNHVISDSGFSGGVACVEISGNVSASLGGVSGVQIQDNWFPISGGGGSGTDIEILNLADDVTIEGNHHAGSSTPIVVAAATTKLKMFNNPGADAGIGGVRIVSFPNPSGALTSAQTSFLTTTTPNDGHDHLYRVGGSVVITTLGSGSINLQVTYSDQAFTSRTATIPLTPQTGAFGAAANTADDWKGSMMITCYPNTAITLKTAGTFTACTYQMSGHLEQLA